MNHSLLPHMESGTPAHSQQPSRPITWSPLPTLARRDAGRRLRRTDDEPVRQPQPICSMVTRKAPLAEAMTSTPESILPRGMMPGLGMVICPSSA
jgi:hypothetical protein